MRLDGDAVATTETRTVAALLGFVDVALDGMAEILRVLGDDLANRKPDLPEANSPYVILTHCLGVMEFWGGHVIADRPFQRDRAAEFTATGSVEGLIDRIREAKRKLRNDVENIDLEADATIQPELDDTIRSPSSNAWVLLHIIEELVQHHGHMEITRDILKRTSDR